MTAFIALPLRILQQYLSQQSQTRIPEPSPLMDGNGRPEVYGGGSDDSNLWAIHAFVGDLAAAIAPLEGEALDLACGTGHVARRLASHLKNYTLTGLDLSEEMLAIARNPRLDNDIESKISFEVGDMLDLSSIEDGRFSLSTWTLAAHHAPGPEAVVSTLKQLNRITHKDGAILVMDLGRLKTKSLNQWYIDYAGNNYDSVLKEEFGQSVFAAYTASEMRDILKAANIPGLQHVALSGLPTLQVLYRQGKAVNSSPTFAPDLPDYHGVPESVLADYATICKLFKLAGLNPQSLQ